MEAYRIKSHVKVNPGIGLNYWKPDKKPHQRDMVEDWVISQGYSLEFEYSKGQWKVRIGAGCVYGQDKSEAFGKAFMNVFNHQNQEDATKH